MAVDKIASVLHMHEVDAEGRSITAKIGGMSSTLNRLQYDELPIVMQALSAAGGTAITTTGFDYTFDFDLE